MLVLDAQGYVLQANGEARRSFGQQAEPGSHFPQRFPAGQHRLPSPEAGSPGWVVDVVDNLPEPTNKVYLFRADAEVGWISEETERLAFEDPLTGLPNWNILSQFVDHSCSQSQRYLRSSALLRVDLDHLRGINQDWGRSSGDEVLVQAAQRLQNNVRSSDIVGRLEGDQFLVILTELTAERSDKKPESANMQVRNRAAVVADRLTKAFRQPFAIADTQVNSTVSIGVAVCPEDARLPAEWMQAAELALGRAKENGGDAHELYAEALKQQHQLKQDRHRQLEQALRQGELAFDWLPVEGPTPLQHYWWMWRDHNLQGPEVKDALEAAGLHSQWGRWQKQHLEQLEGSEYTRLAPLPASWLNPGFDTSVLLKSGFWWEVEEGALHHRHRLDALCNLQEKGLQWVLGCSTRGLQNLSLLGKAQPRLLRLSLPARWTPEQRRLHVASARVADSLGIEVLAMLPKKASATREMLKEVNARYVLKA